MYNVYIYILSTAHIINEKPLMHFEGFRHDRSQSVSAGISY